MTFRDPKLQAHFDEAMKFDRGCPPEERPVRALIDAYYRFEIEDGADSPRAREAAEQVLSSELRPALRSWYQRMGSRIHGHAVQVRERLGKMAGESFG